MCHRSFIKFIYCCSSPHQHRYYNPLLYIITVSLAIDPIWSTKVWLDDSLPKRPPINYLPFRRMFISRRVWLSMLNSLRCESIVLYPVISQLVSQFFISSKWGSTSEACNSPIGTVILTLRTYALYGKSNLILASLIFTYLCCLVAQWYPLQFGVRIPLPHPLVGCILGGTPES